MKKIRKIVLERKTKRSHYKVVGDDFIPHPRFNLQQERVIKVINLKKKEPVEMKRTIPPRKASLRRELEAYVTAWNTVLRDRVASMDIVTLLRNAHPAYRLPYATACAEIGLITEHEAGEFRIGPTPREHSRTNWQA
jgi:hypothetical protein